MSIKIKSRLRDYALSITDDFTFLKNLADNPYVFFVIDKKVYALYKNSLFKQLKTKNLVLLSINEKIKTIETVKQLYKRAVGIEAKKNLILISIGGGITQDITGFFADSIYRGIKWIYIPTTLLAQADSCIGAKTSLNFENYKNLIGTFYPPHAIYVNPNFTKTLKELDYFSGVGEIAKLCIMDSFKSASYFKKNLAAINNRDITFLCTILTKVLKVKKWYIEKDEFDKGIRNMLNYGHCFGHAFESASNFKIPHGQAVVIGMILSNYIANKKGLLSTEKTNFYLKEILKPILKVNNKDLMIKSVDLIKAMRKDKKNTGKGISLVMINNRNKMLMVKDLSADEIKNSLNYLKTIIKI